MENIALQSSKILSLHLELLRYPILADRMREVMREELHRRGVISAEAFGQEVEERAIQSQYLEGITDPYSQETDEVWQRRLQKVADNLTDFYFAYNLPHDLFRDIVQAVLRGRPASSPDVSLAFNPELAPWAILFAQAEVYEAYPPEQRRAVEHHLQEILVVITKTLISDQLKFIGLARPQFTTQDLKHIVNHRIGRGKIGGKAAGMHLAYKILTQPAPEDKIDFAQHVALPQSYYIGADVFYDFISNNHLLDYLNQKYKPAAQIEADYPRVKEAFLRGTFSKEVKRRLSDILAEVGQTPLIIRSSSLLEDSFGTAFAGKYDSFFCANQGTASENLAALLNAIKRVYASVQSPDSLHYRQNMDLLDYDERMAILIQVVVGSQYKHYFLPALAGVGFSRNPFRWSMQINPKAGFLRLVWGMGTRAVDRVDQDYPRLVALSHPLLRPETSTQTIRQYSQHFVDLIDLGDNCLKTLPVAAVVDQDYPGIQYLVSLDKGGYLQPVVALGGNLSPADMVFTFDSLLKNTNFAAVMRGLLRKLERHYKTPIDMEFAVEIVPNYPYPDFKIYVLQCRPLSQHPASDEVAYPNNIPEADILFTANKWITSGQALKIGYIVYVDPETYAQIGNQATKLEIGRVVGRINQWMDEKNYILLGPGRWGSSNIDLGVKVSYADIYKTAILGEIATLGEGDNPEVSYGTHFFQDLVEAQIYPLALCPSSEDTLYKAHFLKTATNQLAQILPADAALAPYVKVIDVVSTTGGKRLDVVMDSYQERAIGYFKPAQVDLTEEDDD